MREATLPSVLREATSDGMSIAMRKVNKKKFSKTKSPPVVSMTVLPHGGEDQYDSILNSALTPLILHSG